MASSQFGWPAAVAVAVVVLWNIGVYLFNTRSIAWRKACHGTNLVMVTNRKAGVSHTVPQTWFAWDLISSTDLVTGPVGLIMLMLYRAFEVCVFVFTVVCGNVLYEPAGGYFFIFFTNWTFVLFGVTGLVGAALTFREWRRQRRPAIPCVDSRKPEGLMPGWTWYMRGYHLLLETVCAASIMLTIFYWFADYVPGSSLRFDNPLKHGASSLLLLLDVALSRTPIVSFHLQVVIGYGTVYLVFLWLYYAGTGIWVYRALDWSHSLAPAFYAALPLLLMLGFAVMAVVAYVREVILVKCCQPGHSCCHHPEESIITAAETAASPAHFQHYGLPLETAGSTSAGHQGLELAAPSPQLAIMLKSS